MRDVQAIWVKTIELKGATNAGPIGRKELEVLED